MYIALGSGGGCTGLAGEVDDCSNLHYFKVYILLLNPFTLPIFNFLAIAGTIGLLMSIGKRHQ